MGCQTVASSAAMSESKTPVSLVRNVWNQHRFVEPSLKLLIGNQTFHKHNIRGSVLCCTSRKRALLDVVSGHVFVRKNVNWRTCNPIRADQKILFDIISILILCCVFGGHIPFVLSRGLLFHHLGQSFRGLSANIKMGYIRINNEARADFSRSNSSGKSSKGKQACSASARAFVVS